jgi:hypothetical protein
LPTTYTGNAGNVSLASAVQISEPASGEARTAASVDTPLQKLADYAEAMRTARGFWVQFSCDNFTVPTGNSFMVASPAQQVTTATLSSVGHFGMTRHIVGVACKGGTLQGKADSAPGTNVTVTLFKNGSTTGVSATWSSGSASFTLDCSGVSFAAGDYIELQLNPVAQIGGWYAAATLPLFAT